MQIIDTAESERNEDQQRINEIRERIAELKIDLQDTDEGRPGEIDVHYKLITENIQLNSDIDLVGNAAVPRITAGNGMDEADWWLEGDHINENLDFARGVVRKRGLGKAIYYKAYAEDDDISSVIDLPEKGKVALIVGIGGGTGSGLMIDVARHLEQKMPTAEISLFGILPNNTEGLKESTNAYAALSELEYLSLIGDSVFQDIVLLPIEPTGFDGKTGNRIQTSKYLRQLDEAAVYLIVSYYTTQQRLEDPFSGAPDYAPFIVAVPQILRYNVEAISDARESVRKILDVKHEAIELEEELYSRLERHLDKHYEEEGTEELTELDRADLTNRIEDLESLLDIDLFKELEYGSVEIFEGITTDAANESDDLVKRIDIMDSQVRAVDTTGQQMAEFKDDIDELLAGILERDIRTLKWRKDLLLWKKAVEDKQVRDAFEYLLGEDESSSIKAGVKLQRLESKVEDLAEREEQLESELAAITEEIEQARDEQEAEVKRSVESWERAVRDEVDHLQTIHDLSVRTHLSELESALDQYRMKVEKIDNEGALETINQKEVIEHLDSLSRELERADIAFQEERSDIENSLSDLKQARMATLQMENEEDLFEQWAPWKSQTEQNREEANKNFQRRKTRLSEMDVFSVRSAGSFTVDLDYDYQSIIDELERTEHRLRQNVVKELRQELSNPSEGVRDELRRELNNTADTERLRDIATKALQRDIVDTGDAEQRRESVESELEDTRRRMELFESTLDLFEDVSNLSTSFREHVAEYHEKQMDYVDESDRPVVVKEDDDRHVRTIQPNDVFRATGSADIIESDIFASTSEVQQLVSNIEQLAKNARRQKYTGLLMRKFSKGRDRFDDIKVRVSVMSRAVNQVDPGIFDFEDIYSGAFDLGASGKRIESPYTAWQREIGGPWDVGLVVFVDGVMLDNIAKVVDADGYRDGYEQREMKLKDDIFIHHSLGLEEGYFVRRRETLNLEADSGREFFLRDDDDEVIDDLLNRYVNKIDISTAGSDLDGESTLAQETDNFEDQ